MKSFKDYDICMGKMKEHFKKRTNMHINLVKENWEFLKKIDNKLKGNIDSHDNSKFKEPEYTPYLYITWKYNRWNKH